MMFFLMFVGGCAGSTTCGIKIFRFQVLYATADAQMRRLIQPHGVFIAYYNGKPIPESVSVSVMSFFFMYVVCFAVLSITLQFLGLDYLTAMTGAASAISNVGTGTGAGDRAERHLRDAAGRRQMGAVGRDAAGPAGAVHGADPADAGLLAENCMRV